MRISLNLNTYPVNKQNFNFKGKQNSSNEGSYLPENEDVFYSESGIRPASLPYNWRKLSSSRINAKLQSINVLNPDDTSEPQKKVNTKAGPTKFPTQPAKLLTVAQAIKKFKNPNDMQDYYVSSWEERRKYQAKKEGYPLELYTPDDDPIIRELVNYIDYKVNKRKLNPKVAENLWKNDLEQIRLGALFAYWSVHYDGESRFGYKKPPYIRSTHEFIATLCNEAPNDASRAFYTFLERLPADKKKKEQAKQTRNARLYEEEWDEYRTLPWYKKIVTPYPIKQLTYLQKQGRMADEAYNAWEQAVEREDRERRNEAKTELEVRASGSLL